MHTMYTFKKEYIELCTLNVHNFVYSMCTRFFKKCVQFYKLTYAFFKKIHNFIYLNIHLKKKMYSILYTPHTQFFKKSATLYERVHR